MNEANTKNIDKLFNDINALFPQFQTTPVSPEQIEPISNDQFKQLYSKEVTMENFIKRLKEFKSSMNKRNNELFACMIYHLIDEYKFFRNYPEE
jgi:CCR4-NOT transcription complex subunit 1